MKDMAISYLRHIGNYMDCEKMKTEKLFRSFFKHKTNGIPSHFEKGTQFLGSREKGTQNEKRVKTAGIVIIGKPIELQMRFYLMCYKRRF